MIKATLVILMILSTTTLTPASQQTLTSLSELTWKNRIILVWTNDAQNYLQSFAKNATEINERDIVWFIFNKKEVSTNFPGKVGADFISATTTHIKPQSNEVILIGKDGGVKRRKPELLLDSLFKQIDKMPMRRSEIRQKNSDN